MSSKLDPGGVLKAAFDDSTGKLQVSTSSADTTSLAAIETALTGSYSATKGALQVGGASVVVPVTVTHSSGAVYVADEQVGGVLSVTSAVRTSGGTGLLQTITILDKAKQKVAFDVLIFNASPTTGADAAAADISDAEMASKFLGVVTVAAADYKDLSANSFVTKGNIAMPIKVTTGTTLYAVLVTRGAPNYTSTTDLIVTFGIIQD